MVANYSGALRMEAGWRGERQLSVFDAAIKRSFRSFPISWSEPQK